MQPLSLTGLSEAGNARLRSLRFVREPRYRAAGDELTTALARDGLPHLAMVEGIERDLGGVGLTLRDGGARVGFATFALLADPARRREHATMTEDSATLEHADAWPQVRLGGVPLVPVAEHVDATVYATADGRLVQHDWLDDTVRPAARDALVLLERWLLMLDLQERHTTGRADEAVGIADPGAVAAALGVPMFEEASDDEGRCWEDASGTAIVWYRSASERVRVVSADRRLLDIARALLR